MIKNPACERTETERDTLVSLTMLKLARLKNDCGRRNQEWSRG